MPKNKRLYNRLMAEGIPFQLEKRLIHRNGSILVGHCQRLTGGGYHRRPHSAVSVYVDISGRKQAENRLALLSRVSELAREFEDPDELMFAVSSAVGEHFQARRALFNEIDLKMTARSSTMIIAAELNWWPVFIRFQSTAASLTGSDDGR